MTRSPLRHTLRWFTQHVPVRGRMKLADKLGKAIAPLARSFLM
jgi:hypothetical protein